MSSETYEALRREGECDMDPDDGPWNNESEPGSCMEYQQDLRRTREEVVNMQEWSEEVGSEHSYEVPDESPHDRLDRHLPFRRTYSLAHSSTMPPFKQPPSCGRPWVRGLHRHWS